MYDGPPRPSTGVAGVERSEPPVVSCSMFDVGCWLFDVRCWLFDVRCWLFDVRCSMLAVRCSMFDVGVLATARHSQAIDKALIEEESSCNRFALHPLALTVH